MTAKNTSNILPHIRGIVDGAKGENYPFADCLAFLMERLGRPDLNYWVFASITGDSITQIYNKNSGPYCDNASQFLAGAERTRYVFDSIGYDYTYVTSQQIAEQKSECLQMLMDSIEKGLPVIAIKGVEQFLYVGYEEQGNTLLTIKGDNAIPEKCDFYNIDGEDWIFAGSKLQDISLDDIFQNAVLKMEHWLTLPEKDGIYFGAAAFRAWADDIENGRYENESDLWNNYCSYICNLASNASNAGGAPLCVEKFAQKHPRYQTMRDDIEKQYIRLSNQDGGIWKALEELGGGFNVTKEVLCDKTKRSKIASKLREAADCLDAVVLILQKNFSSSEVS